VASFQAAADTVLQWAVQRQRARIFSMTPHSFRRMKAMARVVSFSTFPTHILLDQASHMLQKTKDRVTGKKGNILEGLTTLSNF
jgi:hypothetical protein